MLTRVVIVVFSNENPLIRSTSVHSVNGEVEGNNGVVMVSLMPGRGHSSNGGGVSPRMVKDRRDVMVSILIKIDNLSFSWFNYSDHGRENTYVDIFFAFFVNRGFITCRPDAICYAKKTIKILVMKC